MMACNHAGYPKTTNATDYNDQQVEIWCKYLSGNTLPRFKVIRGKLFPDRYLRGGKSDRVSNQNKSCIFKADENEINPAILVSHSKILKEVTVIYPYVKTDLKIANIIAGQKAFAWDMINSSYLPRLVILTFVKNSALTGSYQINTFHFAI